MPELGDTDDSELSGSGSFGSPPNPLDKHEEDPPEEKPSAPSGQEEETPAPTKEEGGAAETDISSTEAFVDTYRISETDAGYTPREILEEMKNGSDREPNELDEQVLDALIMQGYYEREFELGSTSFRLRTADPNVSHNVVRVLQEVLGDEEPMTNAVRGPMLVSQHLSYFREEQMPGAGNNETFSSTEALKTRFGRCMELPTPVLDAIGSRVNAFRQRVEDATERSIANF